MGSQSGKVGAMRRPGHTLLLLIVCLATQARTSDVVEGSGDEEFDQDAAINEAVNKVTELVTSWADNLEDLDLDLEINQEENEITEEKAAKRKRKCEKCLRKHFRGRNTEFCDGCQVEEEEETVVEVTTALTTPPSSNDNLKYNHNNNHRLIQRRRKLEERCQKCTKNSFRARNDNFCSTKCSLGEDDMKEVKTKTSTTTLPTTTTPIEIMTTTEAGKRLTRCLTRCTKR